MIFFFFNFLGHDCRLKRTSPTAYCDCWEKCKCKALIAGSQTARQQLLKMILTETDLVTLPNSKGENILLFLVQTVGRQIQEQRQHLPPRVRTKKTNDVNSSDNLSTPNQYLDPPKFARKALDKILQDWNAVKSMILTGYRGENQSLQHIFGQLANNLYAKNVSYKTTEEQTFLMNQNGTALLDKFTHFLLIKVAGEMLDPLLVTIIKQCGSSNPTISKEARLVARRFVRSVARICVVLCCELSPSFYSNLNAFGSSSSSNTANNNNSSQAKKNTSSSQLQKCKRVFQALLPIAIEELCEIADALIAPVRYGVARPTASFNSISSIQDAINCSEELFLVDPLLNNNNESGNNNSNVGNTSSSSSLMDHSFDQSSGNNLTRGNKLVTVNSLNIVNSSNNENAPINPIVVVDNNNDSALLGFDEDISVPVESGNEDVELEPSYDEAPEMLNQEESDSDSDSNPDDTSYQSNVDNVSAQRSNTTAAAAGSDGGMASLSYFSGIFNFKKNFS